MSNIQALAAIALAAACTLFMRALPFTLLGKKQEIPAAVRYLGKILPAAIMAVLIVYCLKSVPMDFGGTGLCQLLAVGVCVLLHLWKKNTLLSIVGSTAFYMVLLQVMV